jgi:hypothetical protein
MKGRATINIATSANPSSRSLGLPQQHVIKKPNGDHVKHLVGRAGQACPVTGHSAGRTVTSQLMRDAVLSGDARQVV